jgi:pyruvate/2-oxoglutarate dehydrogenase complex dihydrolipoamide dehydrogenase (E3) component
VPYVVFIDPQVGRVGLTEAEARARGVPVRVAKLGMDSVVRAIETSETRGFMKVIVDGASGAILGVANPRLRGRRDHGHAPNRDAGEAVLHRAA